MNVAYLYYYGLGGQNKLTELMKYTLLYARDMCPTSFDVFNCLKVMDNETFLEECKFGMGDGILNYYLYNYALAANNGYVEVSKFFIIDFFLEQKNWSHNYLSRRNQSNYQEYILACLIVLLKTILFILKNKIKSI